MAGKIVSETLSKLARMGDVTLYEPAGDSPHNERVRRKRKQEFNFSDCIANLQTPRGPKPVLKTMLTTACERNCHYCVFRAGRTKTKRMTFSPDAMAGAFDTLQRAKQVDGLFLSSGIIKGSVTTQDKIIDTADIIRSKQRYRGYIHLKIMPGIEYDQLYRAMQLADRISVNLEAPTSARLHKLAPKKIFVQELLRMLQWAEQIRRDHPQERLASSVTQFVVGAVGDTDLELMSMSDKLYAQARLARVYYSSFSPVPGTPFEDLPASDLLREFRLYQSSFLLRDYQWDVEELPFQRDGNLRTDIDPKQAWADEHLVHAPIEIMRAEREELLRIPGVGRIGVEAILRARRRGALRDLAQLKQIGIRSPQKLANYVLLDGAQPARQNRLF
ncbi:MAG: radical SAM protein [Chloroflexi bacterium]|nr:radical SAM protein [Chloroflexota bacterium]MCY3583678.1 radical SAM protein [Chloroflexota bacterium]MCY3716958.1 radical SAM protein [Chloroflexota bacterium]MDE2650142.1 radical SAM protein [Chloroflexota bacterium]MXX50437.1 radical SAM protein [Chloroflexota bacterium]